MLSPNPKTARKWPTLLDKLRKLDDAALQKAMVRTAMWSFAAGCAWTALVLVVSMWWPS